MTAGIVPANKTSSRLEKFFEKIDPVRGRLVFALDATASRQPSWDLSASLTGEMFNAVAAIGGLDVQLIYYRGLSEIFASRWFSDARSLATIMSTIQCRSGHTKIGSVLRHIRRENAHEKVNAAIIISDACKFPQISMSKRASSRCRPSCSRRALTNVSLRFTPKSPRSPVGHTADSMPALPAGWRSCCKPLRCMPPAGSRRWRHRKAKRRSCCSRRSGNEPRHADHQCR